MVNSIALLVAAAATVVRAYPSHNHARSGAIQPYVAPGPDDARGPCPMLNSLANHGYINHDGRNLQKQDLFDAFLNFVGIEESAVDTAFANAMILCEFTTGEDCNNTLKNLTILALPHAFEHDHSFSRQDYNAAPDGTFQDNASFNESVFETSLAVLDGSDHMTFQQMQQLRLQRESLSYQEDIPGWFLENKPVNIFEAGFVFAVMGDFNMDNYINETEVYVPWWRYWFTNESFPYELGWHPPNPPKGAEYVLSVSSRVLAAPVTSTPSILPPGAFETAPPPATLPTQVDTTTYRLETNSPYAGPIATASHAQTTSTAGYAEKRQADSTTTAPASTFTVKNPYVEILATEDIVAQQAYASSRVAEANQMRRM